MRFSNVLTKTILSLYDGKNEGVVISGYFDSKLKKLVGLIIASESVEEYADEFVLPCKNIYKIGKDAITIKNNTVLELKLTLDNISKYSPINSYSYYTNGTLIGKISDLELDEKMNIVSYIVDDKELPANKIASHSQGTIIFYDDEFKISVERLKPSIQHIKIKETDLLTSSPQTAYIMPTFEVKDSATNDTLQMSENKGSDNIEQKTNIEVFKKPLDNTKIQRLTANSNLLIGKKITKNIATQNGELIGKKGNIITSKTLFLASTHQKLRELVLYSE